MSAGQSGVQVDSAARHAGLKASDHLAADLIEPLPARGVRCHALNSAAATRLSSGLQAVNCRVWVTDAVPER